MFDALQLRAATFARHVEIHNRLNSTNDRAAELARQTDVELPALVVAELQTAGKGRGRNTWWSAEGALTFSVLIDVATTGVLPANWPQLSLATAVAVCDALKNELESAEQRGATPLRDVPASTPAGFADEPARDKPTTRVAIKWPNDVMLDGSKVCGILIESPGSAPPSQKRVIIGIGINVNNSWRDAPKDAGSNGTALCDVTGRQHDLPDVLVRVLTTLATRTDQLRKHDAQLVHAWQRLDWLAGQNVTVESNGRRIDGECREIAYDGALVLDAALGRHWLYSGSVRVE